MISWVRMLDVPVLIPNSRQGKGRRGKNVTVKTNEASIPEEEWERFLRDTAAGVGSDDAPKEPSARARMVTRRLREQPAPPEGWRTYRPAAPRRRWRAWIAIPLIAVAVLVAMALDPGAMTRWFADAVAGLPLAAESQRPSGPPEGGVFGQVPTVSAPFRGSPAARWADGPAGIHVPAARETGWMSKSQVAQALDRTRDFLAASNLDAGVLRGARPTEAIRFLNPQQRDVQDYVRNAFRTPGPDNDPLLLFTRFDTAKVQLVGDVVKTRGRITYREGERGALEVSTDVSYVYPVTPAAAGSDEVVRTIVRREVVMSWDDPAKVHIDGGTFSLVSYKSDTTNGGCAARAGYFAPEFGADRTASAPGDGRVLDPYDRSRPVEERTRGGRDDGACGTATRS